MNTDALFGEGKRNETCPCCLVRGWREGTWNVEVSSLPLNPWNLNPLTYEGSNFISGRDLHLIKKKKNCAFLFFSTLVCAASPLHCFSSLSHTNTNPRPFVCAGHFLPPTVSFSRWVMLFRAASFVLLSPSSGVSLPPSYPSAEFEWYSAVELPLLNC